MYSSQTQLLAEKIQDPLQPFPENAAQCLGAELLPAAPSAEMDSEINSPGKHTGDCTGKVRYRKGGGGREDVTLAEPWGSLCDAVKAPWQGFARRVAWQ